MSSTIPPKEDLRLALTPSIQQRVDAHLGRRIRLLRRLHEDALSDVGTVLNRSPQQVSRMESGICRVSIAQLCMISVKYGVTMGWFFRGLEEQIPEMKSRIQERLSTYGQQERMTAYEQQERKENEEALVISFREIKPRVFREQLVSLAEVLASES